MQTPGHLSAFLRANTRSSERRVLPASSWDSSSAALLDAIRGFSLREGLGEAVSGALLGPAPPDPPAAGEGAGLGQHWGTVPTPSGKQGKQ